MAETDYDYQGDPKPRERYSSGITGWDVDHSREERPIITDNDPKEPARRRMSYAAIAAAAVILIAALLFLRTPDVSVSLPEFAAVECGNSTVFPYTTDPRQIDAKKLDWATGDTSVMMVENGVVTGVSVGETVLTAHCGDNTAFSHVFVLGQSLEGTVYTLRDAGQWYEADDHSKLFCVDGGYFWHDAQQAGNEMLMSLLRQAAAQEAGAASVEEKEDHLVCYQDAEQSEYCASLYWAVDENDADVAVIHDTSGVRVVKLDTLQPPQARMIGLEMEQSALLMEVGQEIPLAVYQLFDDGSVLPAQDVTWSCDHADIVAVENGIVKAMAPGSAVVTAAYGEFSCESIVDILAPTEGETEPPTQKPTEGTVVQTARLTGSAATGQPGDTVRVTFRISQASLARYGMKLRYNTSVLTLTGLQKGSYGGTFTGNTGTGAVTFSGTSDTSISGTLFTATFRVKDKAAAGTYTVGVDVDYISTKSLTNLNLNVSSGSVTIKALTPQVPTSPPTDPPTDPPTEPPTEPPTDPPTDPPGRAPAGYSISVWPSTVMVDMAFVVTVQPDVSDYTKIVLHAVDPTGNVWDFTISSGNYKELKVYDSSLVGNWTIYADVYNQYGVYRGASGGARVTVSVVNLLG